MAETQYVIVGGGLAAVSAIEGIRELDKTGPITLLTAERELPYHRPPLSKSFLAGRDGVEAVRVHEAAWYPENKVRVRLNQVAKSVHISRQSIALESGERVEYDKLLLATGCAAKKLNAPGVDTPGVMYLRTLQDCYALRAAIKPGVHVVSVGGGFVGMEVAATARHMGAQVTVVEVGPSLYRGFASPDLSAFFQRVLESQGITVRTGTRVSRFRAQDEKLAAVVADDGEQIPADLAVVGVGAEPNTQWLASSGFSIDRGGLIVNLRLETPGKDVWAAGDIARFPDPVTKQPRRLEHWGNALAQGKQAGRNMAGAGEPYLHQSAFFSDIFDITINVLGDTENADSVEVRGDMDPASPQFTALYAKESRLVGAVTVNLNTADRAAELDDLQRHIRERTIPAAL
jgi:3-phenylpropionate/trans-cinnamate dioxygenase ferredoxin reductase subunit